MERGADVKIERVRSAADLAAVTTLFEAYAAAIGVDLAYQGFADELASLPGGYVPPDGALLLARDRDDAPVGCVAIRRLDATTCEMKRLHVVPRRRGTGLGRRMAEAVFEVATGLGYREIRLDTLPSMRTAQALYASLGFRAVRPYYDGAPAGTLFMGRPLEGDRAADVRRHWRAVGATATMSP